MNKLTLKALEKSIEHWRRMRDKPGCGEEPYAPYCALCQRFWARCERFENGKSERCPVYGATGLRGCLGTPWSAAKHDWEIAKWPDEVLPNGWADAEIAFLEGLRPTAVASEPDAIATATGAGTGTVG